MARRNILAMSKLPEFSAWLGNQQGWTIQPTKGEWEVLRATHTSRKPIVIYGKSQTMRGGETQHASIQAGCPSLNLVHRWLREKRQGKGKQS